MASNSRQSLGQDAHAVSPPHPQASVVTIDRHMLPHTGLEFYFL